MKSPSRVWISCLCLALLWTLPAGAQTKYRFDAEPHFGIALSNDALLSNFLLDPVTFQYFGTTFGNDGTQTDVRAPGWFDTVPLGLANSGAVAGYVDDVDEFFNLTAIQGFIRTPDGRYSTYLYPGSIATLFDACNDAGTVLGEQYDLTSTTTSSCCTRVGQSRTSPSRVMRAYSGRA